MIQDMLEHYRLDHGKYPDKLVDMVRGTKTSLPRSSDGFSYKLKLVGDEMFLYLDKPENDPNTYGIKLFHEQSI